MATSTEPIPVTTESKSDVTESILVKIDQNCTKIIAKYLDIAKNLRPTTIRYYRDFLNISYNEAEIKLKDAILKIAESYSNFKNLIKSFRDFLTSGGEEPPVEENIFIEVWFGDYYDESGNEALQLFQNDLEEFYKKDPKEWIEQSIMK